MAIITGINLDFNDIKEIGGTRKFTVSGTSGAVFSLEVKNKNGFYYNFKTNLFQSTITGLKNISINGAYIGSIKFPSAITTDTVNGAVTSGIRVVMDTVIANTMAVGDRITGNAALDAASVTVAALDPDGDNDNEFSLSEAIAIADGATLSFAGANQYDFVFIAETIYDTRHASYGEARFLDDSIDINSSKGSNSNIVQKVLYQTLDVDVVVSGYSPEGLVTGVVAPVVSTPTATIARGGSNAKIPFSFTFTASALSTLQIDRQPVASDIMAFITATVGHPPVNIPGEDIYPTVTAANKVVNGAVTSGVTVTMDDNFTGLWTLGDKITGNAALDARTQATAVTVTAINVGSNAKVFTMSEAIAIADDETLSFSNRRNHRWPISSTTEDVGKIIPGMRQLKADFFEAQPTVKNYLTQITVNEGAADERKIDDVRVPALEISGKKPTIVRDSVTKVATKTLGTSTDPINITFSEQALQSFGSGANAKIFGYGVSEVERLTGYDVEFSNLKVELTKVTTTTTTAPSAATTFNVASAVGITENISTINGIGINTALAAPTVTRIKNTGGATWTGGAAQLTTAAQTLESGITLTFPGSSRVATISGNMKVNKAGNKDVILRFDIERFLTMQTAAADV
mgnify:CR=1 FL=1